MEKTITQLEGCFRKMEIKVPLADMEPYYEKGYRDARKNVQMPGFRRGKVPMNMIKKLYGQAVEMEAHQDAINEMFPKIAEEDKIAVLGQPSLTNIEKQDDEVVFSIEYETLPDIHLEDYKSMVIDEPVHSVEDDEIAEELKTIQNENADFEPAKHIEDENYVLMIEMTEVDPETKEPLEGTEPQEVDLYLNDKKAIPELKEALIGKDINDVVDFTTTAPDENTEPKHYKIKINDVQKLIPKELTSEFIKEYTKERFDSLDDLKEEIGFQLQEQWDKKSREQMENQIVKKIVDMHENVTAPDAVVENVMKNMFEDFKRQYSNLPKDTFDYEKMKEVLRPRATDTVKFELIRNRIIEEEEIKVEDFDIEADVEAYAKETKMDREEVKNMLLKNEGYLNSVLHKKVIDFILGFVETREVDFEGNPLDEEDNQEENNDEINNESDTSEEK